MQLGSNVPLSAQSRKYLRLGRFGFWGLWLLQPLWILWLAPPELGNAYVLLALLWLPLWLPLYGIVRGHAYTMAWANFIVMIYFLHSLTNLWVSSGMRWGLSLLELILAASMFIGCTYYARYRGQELGLKIPKLKDEPEFKKH